MDRTFDARFSPIRLSAAMAIFVGLMLNACIPASQTILGGGPTESTPLLPSGATGPASGPVADGPEGARAADVALSRTGDAALLTLGDVVLLTPPPEAVRTVDGMPVALLAPLSGRLEGAGTALLEGAQMALFDVGNSAVRLIPIDTGGTAMGAERAAHEAVRQGAKMIIGPLLAESVAAIRPMAEAAGIKVIAFSNSSRIAGEPIYLAGFTPEEQISAIVDSAMAEGRTRFAVLAPLNDYGNVAVDALRDTVIARSGEFSRIGFYDPATLDFADPIQRLSNYKERVKALEEQRAELEGLEDLAAQQALKRLETLDTWGDPPFDALLLPVLNIQTLQILSAQLSYYDVDQPVVRVLGLQRWDSFANLQNEPGLIGSRYPTARSIHRGRFDRRFQSYFGHRPPELSALAYDVTAVAASLAGDGRTPPRYDTDTLTNPEGFIGIEGLFRFNRDGVIERGFAIMEVSQDGVVMIQEAPRRFGEPTLPAS